MMPGQVTELCCEGGSDQRSGTGNCREVMAEHDPTIRRHVVSAVFEANGRRRPVLVEGEDLRRDHLAIEAIGDDVSADGCGEQPCGVDRFAPRRGDVSERGGPRNGEEEQKHPRVTTWTCGGSSGEMRESAGWSKNEQGWAENRPLKLEPPCSSAAVRTLN